MKQPKCPWCGMGFRGDQSDLWHVEGFREEGHCGSQWFPDFEGGHTEGRRQSEACREIVRLKIAHLRRMAKASADLVGSWPSFLASIPPEHEDANSWRARWIRKHMALQSACLAKITELKELQCSTKS